MRQRLRAWMAWATVARPTTRRAPALPSATPAGMSGSFSSLGDANVSADLATLAAAAGSIVWDGRAHRILCEASSSALFDQNVDAGSLKTYQPQHWYLACCRWRAVIKIGTPSTPSTTAILENAHGLARYAQIAQVCSCVMLEFIPLYAHPMNTKSSKRAGRT